MIRVLLAPSDSLARAYLFARGWDRAYCRFATTPAELREVRPPAGQAVELVDVFAAYGIPGGEDLRAALDPIPTQGRLL